MAASAPGTSPPGPRTSEGSAPDTSPASGNAPTEPPEEQQLLQNVANTRPPAAAGHQLYSVHRSAHPPTVLDRRYWLLKNCLFSTFVNWKKGLFVLVILLVVGGLPVMYFLGRHEIALGTPARPTPFSELPSRGSISKNDQRLVVLALAPQKCSEPCPDDWLYYRKVCYFYAENDTDWSSANSFCSERNAGLITFKDCKEMGHVLKWAGQHGHWIGLNKTGKVYTWVNGQPLDKSEFTIQGAGDCGYIKSNNDRAISLATCSLPMHFICTMEPYKVRRSSSPTR